MSEAVRGQSLSRSKGKEQLENAHSCINDLRQKIIDIRIKSDESEEMVKSISNEIRYLDIGKRNLTTTISSLKKLQMLITSLERMAPLIETGRFADIPEDLRAAQDLVNFFTPFNIPQVNTHIHDFDRLKQKLVDKIKREIPAGLSDLEREILETETARLHGACECATIFGDDVRLNIIKSLCADILHGYHREFENGEKHDLKFVGGRYMWWKKAFHKLEARRAIIPSSWSFYSHFGWEFCVQTRKELDTELQRRASEVSVSILVQVLTSTIDFENDLDQLKDSEKIRYEKEIYGENPEEESGDEDEGDDEDDEGGKRKKSSFFKSKSEKQKEDEEEDEKKWKSNMNKAKSLIKRDAKNTTATGDDDDEDDENNLAVGSSASAIRAKYMRKREKKRNEEKRRKATEKQQRREQTKKTLEQTGKSVLVFYAPNFHGAISGCFGPHLHTFVEQEKLELRKFNDVLRPKDDTVSDKDGGIIYGSSCELFKRISSVCLYCKRLSTMKPLVEIFQNCMEGIVVYLDNVRNKLPRSVQNLIDENANISLTPAEELTVCYVLNTAYFCTNTVQEFTEHVMQYVDEKYRDPKYINCDAVLNKSSIILKETQLGLVLACVGRIINPIIKEIPDFIAKVVETGDENLESKLGNTLTETLVRELKTITTTLYDIRWKRLMSIFTKCFIDRFNLHLGKIKKITVTAGNKLLLDIGQVESTMSNLPKTLSRGMDPQHTKHVQALLKDTKNIFKLASNTSYEHLLDSFLMYFPFPAGTRELLVRIVDLRQLKKDERTQLLERFEQKRKDFAK